MMKDVSNMARSVCENAIEAKHRDAPDEHSPRSAKGFGITQDAAISGAQSGDEQCFELLYTTHKRRVYSLCLRMTGDCARAEDLTQEAFLQLYRKIGSFRGESAFSTWLHRLTVNIVLMAFRKKGLPETSLEEQSESRDDEGRAREFGAVDRVLHGSLDRITLDRAIAELPPGYH